MITTHRTATLQFEAFFRTKRGEGCYTCHVCGRRDTSNFDKAEGLMTALLWHLKGCDGAAEVLAGSLTIDGERSMALVMDGGRRMIITSPRRPACGTIYERASPRPATFFKRSDAR